jgi:quercetin dioxygenase-like cupin family protein
VAVLHRAAGALQVSVEELLSTPRAACEFFPLGALPTRTQGDAKVRRLLPHAIPGMEMDRIELPPRGRMTGIPHTPGTREYLTCISGRIELVASGEKWQLEPGDALVFRGDQRHGYRNLDAKLPAVAISVVCFAPAT